MYFLLRGPKLSGRIRILLSDFPDKSIDTKIVDLSFWDASKFSKMVEYKKGRPICWTFKDFMFSTCCICLITCKRWKSDWEIKSYLQSPKGGFLQGFNINSVVGRAFKVEGDVGQMSGHYHCISSHYSARTLASHSLGGGPLTNCISTFFWSHIWENTLKKKKLTKWQERLWMYAPTKGNLVEP